MPVECPHLAYSLCIHTAGRSRKYWFQVTPGYPDFHRNLVTVLVAHRVGPAEAGIDADIGPEQSGQLAKQHVRRDPAVGMNHKASEQPRMAEHRERNCFILRNVMERVKSGQSRTDQHASCPGLLASETASVHG